MTRSSLLALAALLVAAACSSVETVPPGGSGGSAGAGVGTTSGIPTTGSQGGGGGDAGAPPATTRFVLSFVSDIPESIWVDETDSAWLGTGHWLSLLRDGAIIRKAKACETCGCDECPNCPVCGAPCDTATEVASGQQRDWEWAGYEYPASTCPSSPGNGCLAQVVSPPGDYVARFCWGTSFTGTPPCPALVADVQCAEVAFQHPDPDGVVEYVVNNSG